MADVTMEQAYLRTSGVRENLRQQLDAAYELYGRADAVTADYLTDGVVGALEMALEVLDRQLSATHVGISRMRVEA